MRRGLVLLLLTLTGGIARAEEPPKPPAAPAAPAPPATTKPAPPPTPEQAADAVLAALRATDEATLKALAAKDDPDPWLVADELTRRGEFDAAESFAKAAPRVDVEKLPAYLATRRGMPDDAAARKSLTESEAAFAERNSQGALEALGPADAVPPADVVGILRAFGRGLALQALNRLEDSAAAFLVAAEAAERVGWLARASRALHESGMSAYRRSDLRGALSAWERRLEMCERRGDKTGAAKTIGNIGNVYYGLGDYLKALATHERALAAKEALGDKAGAAKTLGNIGNVYDSLGDYAKALATHQRSLAAKEALGDREGAAATLCNIGTVYYRRGDYANALATFECALAMQEALGANAGAATTLGNIGNVYYGLGDYLKALATHERALAAQEALGDKAGAAATLGNIGSVYSALGDYARALATHERALAAQEAVEDKAGAAMTLGNIGNVYARLGDYAKALAKQERALADKEALGDMAGAAATLGNIGNVYYRLGDYAKALATYERALAAQEALGDKAGAAATLGNIGNVYDSLGDYAKALATDERALAAQEALGDKAGAAAALGNIGTAYSQLGDHAKALATQGRALAAQEALGNKAGAATTLGNIGSVYSELGDYAKALATQERALAAQEALGDKAGAILTLCNIGLVHSSLGDTAKAIGFLERAARAAEKLGAIGLHARALWELARARLESGDAGRAIELAHRAVSLLKTLVGGLGEEQGATAREQYTRLFATGLSAAAKAMDAPEAVFFLESARAGTMLESLDARDALRRAALPDDLRLAEASVRSGEARALVAYTKTLDGGDLSAIRARREELEAARGKVQEVVERIQRDAKRVAHLWYPVASPVEDILGFLSPGDALVLYGLAEKDNAAHALVLTKRDARIVVLAKSSEIVAACEALETNDPSSDPATAVGRLRDLLVKPLSLSKETTRLLVSPEGPLCYVPFSALVPDLDVAYEPSGTTYGVLLEEKDQRGAQVLALGDPDYTAKFDPTALDVYAPLAQATPGATRGDRLAALPGTRAEATAIGSVALLGKDASEGSLRAALAKHKERWRSVHFACHGLVNPDRPTLSSLALTSDGEDDGFLTALEVLRMEIPSDLVVLSACETGKGKIVGGEGIVGLTRAFMYAGSPRVICSLWKVDDAATKALMVKFYELWNPKDGKPGVPTAEALRQAQDFVRSQERWKHPYYWAAWVLWGLPD